MDLTTGRSGVAAAEEQSRPRGSSWSWRGLHPHAGSGPTCRVWICAWLPQAPAGQPGGLGGARAQAGRCPERLKSHRDDQQMPLPRPRRRCSGVSPLAGQPLLWRCKHKPFPWGSPFFSALLWGCLGVFLSPEIHQPQAHPQRPPLPRPSLAAWPEGSGGARRGLGAAGAEGRLVTHLGCPLPGQAGSPAAPSCKRNVPAVL